MSRPQMSEVSSVGGMGTRVHRSVHHGSLVSRAGAAVLIIPPAQLPTVPAHHHDNNEPKPPGEPPNLQAGLVSDITRATAGQVYLLRVFGN